MVDPITFIPEAYASEFLTVLQNGLKAIGGLATVWVVFAVSKWWYVRKNTAMLENMQKDLRKIKKKLKAK